MCAFSREKNQGPSQEATEGQDHQQRTHPRGRGDDSHHAKTSPEALGSSPGVNHRAVTPPVLGTSAPRTQQKKTVRLHGFEYLPPKTNFQKRTRETLFQTPASPASIPWRLAVNTCQGLPAIGQGPSCWAHRPFWAQANAFCMQRWALLKRSHS